eukprot:6303737-Lingulodinium_polyedra.AAC.1
MDSGGRPKRRRAMLTLLEQSNLRNCDPNSWWNYAPWTELSAVELAPGSGQTEELADVVAEAHATNARATSAT